ncbi:hypothetical protein MRB53_007485 [Persea americana]|uniref:Uncharacterized protein n=1 Tax=Persea americana TaxID=3435 RepID=A0ACC2MKP3_PERAE|nr:hypothetical protein MRB53_007485 [Persea americana]
MDHGPFDNLIFQMVGPTIDWRGQDDYFDQLDALIGRSSHQSSAAPNINDSPAWVSCFGDESKLTTEEDYLGISLSFLDLKCSKRDEQLVQLNSV